MRLVPGEPPGRQRARGSAGARAARPGCGASSASSAVITVAASVGPKRDGISSGRTCDDAREREQELAVGERVLGRVAPHDRRQQVGGRCRASRRARCRAGARSRPRLPAPRGRGRSWRRSAPRPSRRRRARSGPPGRPRRAARSPRAAPRAPRRSRARCAVTQTPEALMQERPPFSTIDDAITSTWRCQSALASGPSTHLAVAGAVHLHARVGLPRAGRGHVAEDHAAPAAAQDLAGAGVVGGVEAEGVGGDARRHEGLDHAVGRPGLGAAGLQHERRARARSWGPRARARRASCSAARRRASGVLRDEADGRARHLAVALVEHVEVEPAREARRSPAPRRPSPRGSSPCSCAPSRAAGRWWRRAGARTPRASASPRRAAAWRS